jgi:hypothetical protein
MPMLHAHPMHTGYARTWLKCAEVRAHQVELTIDLGTQCTQRAQQRSEDNFHLIGHERASSAADVLLAAIFDTSINRNQKVEKVTGH